MNFLELFRRSLIGNKNSAAIEFFLWSKIIQILYFKNGKERGLIAFPTLFLLILKGSEIIDIYNSQRSLTNWTVVIGYY